jgi:hypothetical protein
MPRLGRCFNSPAVAATQSNAKGPARAEPTHEPHRPSPGGRGSRAPSGCAHCSIPTEVGHPHPLDAEDRGVWRETWGLVGIENGSPKVFPTCGECYQAGWRPPGCLP